MGMSDSGAVLLIRFQEPHGKSWRRPGTSMCRLRPRGGGHDVERPDDGVLLYPVHLMYILQHMTDHSRIKVSHCTATE